MKPEELEIIADMVVRLTEFEKKRAVEKPCVSSPALGWFGDFLAAYAKHDRVEVTGSLPKSLAESELIRKAFQKLPPKPCPHNNTTPIDEHRGGIVFYKECKICGAKCSHDDEWFGWRRL